MYRIRTDDVAIEQIDALPVGALTYYAQLLGLLELVPWNGKPHNEANPDANMRQVVFGDNGQGYVIYLILDDQEMVDVLRVVWVG